MNLNDQVHHELIVQMSIFALKNKMTRVFLYWCPTTLAIVSKQFMIPFYEIIVIDSNLFSDKLLLIILNIQEKKLAGNWFIIE
jgi:hypothetical protein